ncbi:MAG TPA: hypothetical protein VKU00_06165 [Chthonomonadaceae bacterium]|nr:hypothetical protein [Chthonomonadaceae bacterium]
MVVNRVGTPVRGEDCYGREAFVELVWEKIERGHVLLAAPRRFGKTSVMYRLIDAPRGNYRIVHVDLQGMTDPASFLTELIADLASDNHMTKIVSGLSYFPRTIWQGFRRNIEELEIVKFKIKLREQIRPDWQQSGEELFKRIAAAGQPVLFILDEFPMMIDRMARSETHREEAKTLLRWLRALRLAPDFGKVRFLIAGSIGIGHVLNSLGEIAAINDFEQLRLEPFSAKVAAQFVDELSKTHEMALSDPSRRKLLQLPGTLVPYFIQILFSEVYKAYRLDREAVTPKKIEQIYREKVLGVDCKTYFDHYHGRLRDYYLPQEERAIKRLLRELAVTGTLSRDVCWQFYKRERGEEADIEAFNALMTNLENDFYIRYDAEPRQYAFACKLLRDWWLRHYAMEASD